MSSLSGGIDLGDMFAPKNKPLAAMKGANGMSSANSLGAASGLSGSGAGSIKSASYGQRQPEPSYNLDVFGDLSIGCSGSQGDLRPASK